MTIVPFIATWVALVTLVAGGTVAYPSYPLAVKSPYLSTWMPGTETLPTGQPEFWTGSGSPLVWNVMARVTSGGNTQTYTLFGFPNTPTGTTMASQAGPISLTATRTQMNLTAGIATFQLEFMSIIDPANYTIHSLPYSYLAVTASSSSPAAIQIFSSIGDNWTAQNGATTIFSGTQGSTKFFFFNNAGQKVFRENNQQAAWGSTVYASQPRGGSTVTSNFGNLTTIYQQFINTGTLGTPAPSGRSAVANGVAFSHSLSSVTSAVKVVFAVGADRAQSINFTGQTQTGYYRATFATIPPAVDFFLSYYDQALAAMQTLDSNITAMGLTVSQNYADILDACVRQTYGAYELTIPLTTNLSTAVTRIFEKEISSDGNLNSIDSIFPALPLLYLISPDFLSNLMRPVLDFIKGAPTGPLQWTPNFSIHDIGGYPQTTNFTTQQLGATCGAPARPEYMPLESTANMLIIIAAQAQKAGNADFASNYLGPGGKYILTTYADYLAANGTYPSCQVSTVDSISPRVNQTQLAIISAVALGAMGKMLGMSNYTIKSQSLAQQLLNPSFGALTSGSTPHFTYWYNQPATWSVMFPLFADSLLGLNLFQSVYQAQSSWYASQFSSYGLQYAAGVAASRIFAITDWNFWSAATSSAAVQNMVIDTTHKFMTDGLNTEPWGTKYNVTNGLWIGNRARDTVGANWAIYVLNSL